MSVRVPGATLAGGTCTPGLRRTRAPAPLGPDGAPYLEVGALAVEHRAVSLAHEPHQVALGSAALERVVGEGLQKAIEAAALSFILGMHIPGFPAPSPSGAASTPARTSPMGTSSHSPDPPRRPRQGQ